MPLAETTYKTTDKEPVFAEALKPEVGYHPSDEDSKALRHVLDRFQRMRSARTRVDVDWQTWKRISESKFYPYADGRTRVNVPLFRALQELFVSEATTRRIERLIEPVGISDVDKAEVMKEVWDYEWQINARDEEMTDAEYKCCEMGTCAYFTGFEQRERIIHDPTVGTDGKISYTKKLMRQGRIILKTLDIRNVYFDDRTNDFDDDDDQIYIEYITPEQFREEMHDPNSQNLEYVGTTSKIDQVYYTYEEQGKLNQDLVEKMHYWSKGADKHIIIYDRQIVGRNAPLPYAHKELPIVPRQFGKVVDSKYGRGLAEACMQFLDKYNRLSEMIFDGISRSNNSIFAIGGGLTFDGNKFSFNNQILKFNGQLNDANFREIKGIPPNNVAFEYLQELLKEIAIFIGIDISQIIGQASSTAFQTAQKVESGLKRVNTMLLNRDYSLQKVFTRHLENLQQFFPVALAEKVVEVTPKGEVKPGEEAGYSKILLKNKKYIPETGKMVEENGKFEFECKPEYIRGRYNLLVKTNYNSPSLRSLKQDSLDKFMVSLERYSVMLANNPDLQKLVKPDQFIKQLAYNYDVDIDAIGGFADSISRQWDDMMNKLNEAAGMMTPALGPGGAGGGVEGMPGAGGLPGIPGQGPGGGGAGGVSSTGMPTMPNVQTTGLPKTVQTPEIPSMDNMSPAEKVMM